MFPPQPVPLTSVNLPWHSIHTPAASPQAKSSTDQYNMPQASSSTRSHPGPPSLFDSRRSLLHPSDATTSSPTRGQEARVSVASHNSSSPEVELTEAERAAASDEKRRRNTAASGTSFFLIIGAPQSSWLILVGVARFRIKKKHRTITLERTVSDLTGRAEELEREVGDLRRENGWLKEIVMLKGTQNVANNRLALKQAVALATVQRACGSEATSQGDVSEGSS